MNVKPHLEALANAMEGLARASITMTVDEKLEMADQLVSVRAACEALILDAHKAERLQGCIRYYLNQQIKKRK